MSRTRSLPARVATALPYAAAGVLATLAGTAAGHLVASLRNPSSSPVLAVGSTVIDLTPTPVKEFAVREFGTNDKPILIGSVLAGTLVLAGVAGALSRRRLGFGTAFLVLLVGTAGVLALLRPLAIWQDAVPAVAAGLVGVPVLVGLCRLAHRSEPAAAAAAAAGQDHASSPREGPGGSNGDGAATVAAPSRRAVLLAGGVTAAAALVMGWVGERVVGYRTRIGDVLIPGPTDPLPPLAEGLEQRFPGISDFRTPNADFYRVDINLTLPVVPVDDWELTIDGDVENPYSLSFDELTGMPLVERDITLTCVSNEVGGPYVGGARWVGVPLKELLDRARVGHRADQVLSTAVDGFTISTPLAVALDGRDTMVAIGMNGGPLPGEHGFPARLVTPGLYGFVGATKWLRRLTLTTYDDRESYWTKRGWATEAPIKISSRIDTPEPLATLASGRTVVGGVAWCQHRGIAKVEVRVDGGAWQEARLGPDAGVDYWRQWYFPWEATAGQHLLAVRATTVDGEVQTAARMTPFPEGSSGIQEIVVRVA